MHMWKIQILWLKKLPIYTHNILIIQNILFFSQNTLLFWVSSFSFATLVSEEFSSAGVYLSDLLNAGHNNRICQ